MIFFVLNSHRNNNKSGFLQPPTGSVWYCRAALTKVSISYLCESLLYYLTVIGQQLRVQSPRRAPTCQAKLGGSWLHQSDPPPRSGSRWGASVTPVHRSARPSVVPRWSSEGSLPKHLTCETKSGGFLSPGRSSREETTESSFLFLREIQSLSL